MNYEELFKNNKSIFGDSPTPVVKHVANIYLKNHKGGRFLDIGAGQGRDSLYLAKLGFNVLAVDISEEACKQISTKANEIDLNNIKVENTRIEDLIIKKNSYDIISCINLLHFLEKDVAISSIKNMISGLKKNGFIIIKLFIKKNGFKSGELKDLFDDHKIISYEEALVEDPGHPGEPKPHTHNIATIVAQNQKY